MEGPTVEARIHDAIHRLTAAERRAARGLLANYPTIGLAPVAEFAGQAGASAATVLRFVAALGYRSYPDFQRALRRELEERVKSPLQRSAEAERSPAGTDFLARFIEQVAGNLRATAERMPAAEFEAAARRIGESKGALHLIGGRFTDAIAAHFEAHLRIVRPGVRHLDARPSTRADQLIDVRAGDCAVIFDIRRYDPVLAETARSLTQRKAFVILITDEWISPAARHAKIVLPCQTGVGRTWDANSTLFAVTEALVARVTELSWSVAEARIGSVERR